MSRRTGLRPCPSADTARRHRGWPAGSGHSVLTPSWLRRPAAGRLARPVALLPDCCPKPVQTRGMHCRWGMSDPACANCRQGPPTGLFRPARSGRSGLPQAGRRPAAGRWCCPPLANARHGPTAAGHCWLTGRAAVAAGARPDGFIPSSARFRSRYLSTTGPRGPGSGTAGWMAPAPWLLPTRLVMPCAGMASNWSGWWSTG